MVTVLVVMTAVYVIWEYVHRYRRIGRRLDQRVQVLRERQTRVDRLDELQARTASTRRTLVRARRKLTPENGFIPLMQKLEELAHSSGIRDGQIVEISRGSTDPNREVDTAPIRRLNIAARLEEISWESLVNLLWRLDRIERLVSARFLEVQRSNARRGKKALNVKITLEVYRVHAVERSGEGSR